MKGKDIAIIVGALAAAILLTVAQFSRAAVATGAWGLSFSAEGKTPSGPASTAQLEKLDAAYVGNSEEKVLYLTFDAGYENGYTDEILEKALPLTPHFCWDLVLHPVLQWQFPPSTRAKQVLPVQMH